MTWKDFKEQVETSGVKDEMTMDWIDTSSDLGDDELRVIITNQYFTISS